MNETSKTTIANRADPNWDDHRRAEHWRALLSMGLDALTELWRFGKTAIRLGEEEELTLREVARLYSAPLEAVIIARQLERAYPTLEEFDSMVSQFFSGQYDPTDLLDFLAVLWDCHPVAKNKRSIGGYVASSGIGWYPNPDPSSREDMLMEYRRLNDRRRRSGLRRRVFGFDGS